MIELCRYLHNFNWLLIGRYFAPLIYLSAVVIGLGQLDVAWTLKGAAILTMSACGMLILPLPVKRFDRILRIVCWTLGPIGVLTILVYQLNNAWVDHHGFNGAVWSIFGRVIARHGFYQTGGHCFWTGGSNLVNSAELYNHHPPGLAWLIACAFNLLGTREAVARIVPIFFSASGALAFVILLAKKMGTSAAAALPVLATAPGFAYFGRMVNSEPIILGLTLIFYAGLMSNRKGRWLTCGLVSIILIMPLIGWVGLPCAALAAYEMGRQHFGWRRRAATALVLVPITVFIFAVLHNTDWGRNLSAAFARAKAWNNLLQPGLADYTLMDWLLQVGQHIGTLTPWPFWIFICLPGTLRCAFKKFKPLLLGVIIPFTVMVPIMPHAVYIHDYHMLYWWPCVAIAVTVCMAKPQPLALTLICALWLIWPAAQGLRIIQSMHAEGCYAIHQAIIGKNLHSITAPDATVAIVNTAGDSAPILAYYLDRHYQIYTQFEPCILTARWEYCCFVHNFDNVIDAHRQLLDQKCQPVSNAYVPTYICRHQQ
jgi:hypothetical protein